jgi:hypothetical protein
MTTKSTTRHAQTPVARPQIDGRLGWRLAEWTALTGTSLSTTSRQIRRGDLRVVRLGATRIVPRSEAVRLGFIQS